MLGERPTIADFSLAGYVYYPPTRPASTSRRTILRWMPGGSAWRFAGLEAAL